LNRNSYAVMTPLSKRTRKRRRALTTRQTKKSPGQRPRAENPPRNPVPRRRSAGRPIRKRTTRIRAVAAPPVQAIPDARQVQDVLDRLARAQAELAARAIDLLNVAHAIRHNAVATFKQELITSLVQDNLLHDLEQLRTALAATPLSADLRLLPEATLNWLCRHLDLSQHLQTGQELEVPAERLSQYDLQGAPPAPEQPLAKLRVLAPGWKHQGHLLISPRMTIVVPAPSEQQTPVPDCHGKNLGPEL
jgi:hypothetical protein